MSNQAMEGSRGSLASVIRKIAANGLANQELHDGDYYGKDGLLVCGKCGRPRQKIQFFESGSMEPLKVTCDCLCDIERRKREEIEKKKAAEMERIKMLKNMSLMDERLKNATFEVFEETKYNARNLKLCKRYATAFNEMMERCQGLLMWGAVGTGKSFAAASIANYLLDHQVPVIMTSFTKILEIIDADRSEESNTVERLHHAKLVIFDDLGAERSTDYAIEKVYNIVNSRYLKRLPMILTTNLTLDEMKSETNVRYSRIYDRIFEMCYPMQFTGPSWRKKYAAKRYEEMEKFLEGED